MQQQRLNELRQQLLAEGYSSRYVSRLCEELEDHYQSSIESDPAILDEDDGACAIGTVSEIRDAVVSRSELRPLIDRFSLLLFLLLPGILVCVLATSLIYLGSWIATADADLFARDQIVNWLPAASTFCIILMAACVSILACKGKRLLSLIPSCCIISLMGLQNIDLTGCSDSGSVFYRSWWGISWLNFLAPWITALTTICLYQWMIGSKLFLKSPTVNRIQDRINLSSTRHLGSLVASWKSVLVAGVVVSLFVLIVSHAQNVNEMHAVDNLVRKYNQPAEIQYVQLELIAEKRFRDALDISASNAKQIDAILQKCQNETQRIAADWRAADPQRASRYMGMEHFSEPVSKACVQLAKLLSDRQRNELVKLAYQRLGSKLLFVTQIQAKINISDSQLESLKNSQLAVFGAFEEVQARAIDSQLTLDQFEFELKVVKTEYERELIDILSKPQLETLSQIMGHDIRAASSFHSELARPKLVSRASGNK